jgi:hypothetical protein
MELHRLHVSCNVGGDRAWAAMGEDIEDSMSATSERCYQGERSLRFGTDRRRRAVGRTYPPATLRLGGLTVAKKKVAKKAAKATKKAAKKTAKKGAKKATKKAVRRKKAVKAKAAAPAM